MTTNNIYNTVIDRIDLSDLEQWIGSAAPIFSLKEAPGSLRSFIIARIQALFDGSVVVVAPEADQAAQILSDLIAIGEGEEWRAFLPTNQHPYDDEQVHDSLIVTERLDLLTSIQENGSTHVVTSAEALFEKIPRADELTDQSLTVDAVGSVARNEVADWLAAMDFSMVEFVSEPGEAAIRGGIIDVFPFTGDYPVRIEFFGDEVDTIREFDATSQRSVSHLSTCRLVPDISMSYQDITSSQTLLDTLDYERTLLITIDEAAVVSVADRLFELATEAYHASEPEQEMSPPEVLYASGAILDESLHRFRRITTGAFALQSPQPSLSVNARPQHDFNASIPILKNYLKTHADHDVFIICDSKGQLQRLTELLETELMNDSLNLLVGSLHEGFELPENKLAVLTDHQIFNRFHRPSTRTKRKRRGLSLRALQDLNAGDFVVHVDYGIGTFAGLKKITVRGKSQEAAHILYRDNDSLYVNVNSLHKLHKYSGKEGHQPQLTQLGSGQWERKKARTKKRVKDIARDLIKLYAQRRAADGFSFSRDTVWQQEMEASFQYEDTPDQSTAVELVKHDMMQPAPMDRLICGDVGFGKTEVAVRAAFKAVQDGKQVALLVPTTILAEQHNETFQSRLSGFPVRIETLSRFRTRDEQKQILKDAASGRIDILIGTHRLTSADVSLKDLGLLIIDEEQRFGVGVKEKLRKLKVNVDTLTLTATPIPRTLQFSLLGARDLSIMSTPPPNRQPIMTEIHTFDSELIHDAIMYELSRGGQVFFIHNRIQSIEEMAARLRDAVPDIRLRIAHGQMTARALESVMLGFKNRKFDVLLSTNIIENGLDIPNANTIIINHANRFGLAELHQLRGRVGRSDRKAFCYLLVSSIHGLTREARQRLQALEEFSDLGAGFGLAMRDMDIRGAGNLLGAEQSGFIADVGFETYHKILDDAVRELREDEFQELFEKEPVKPGYETSVDVDGDALIPKTYISNNLERLNIYRRMAEIQSEAELATLRDELRDRFGSLPDEVEALFVAARLRILGQSLHLKRVAFKNNRLFLTFPLEAESTHFNSSIFKPVLQWLSELDRRYVLKENRKGAVRAIIQDVPDLATAVDLSAALAEHAGDIVPANG